MDVSSFMGGNFFSQVDLYENYQQMTIVGVDQQEVGSGANAEQKICLHFSESPKPLALNKTNLKRVVALYGNETGGWVGGKLLVYRSQTSYGGEVMLCVRLCGVQQAPPDSICDVRGNLVVYQQVPQQQPQLPPEVSQVSQQAPPQQQSPPQQTIAPQVRPGDTPF